MVIQNIIYNSVFYSSLFQDFGLEILFLTIILIVSFSIYRTTKSPYEMTKHKGIKYFRNAFLFLGFAFLCRFLFYILSYIHYYRLIDHLDLAPRMLGGGSMFIYVLTSSIALLSLLYALSYNKFKKKELSEYLIYVFSVFIAIASFFMFKILLITHIFIALVVIFSVLFQHKKQKNNSLGVAYIGLAVFWILSIIGDLLYFSIFDFFKPILYSILTIILLFISFRTIKRIK